MNFVLAFALCFCCTSALQYSHQHSTDKHTNQCRPENVIGPKVVSCDALGTSVPIGGGLYQNWELHYNLMMSPYYAARMADALGYGKCCPGQNRNLLKGLNLMTPWSGNHSAIAIDGVFGFDRDILRRCTFPSGTYPFLCTLSRGTPRTSRHHLGNLSYISLLHDNKKHKWTLFGHCWNPKTPTNPNSVPTATSFNVFSLDAKLPAADRTAIIAKIRQLGFSTNDIIEPDFTGSPVSPQC